MGAEAEAEADLPAVLNAKNMTGQFYFTHLRIS